MDQQLLFWRTASFDGRQGDKAVPRRPFLLSSGSLRAMWLIGGEKWLTFLAAGTSAPDFRLHVTPNQYLSLSDLRGKPVILGVYPADWSPVCGDERVTHGNTQKANYAA
jgi:hypothetical protein